MLIPVILSGGSGTRLWPLSRELYPKQFLPLVGERTMLQDTADRLVGLGAEPPIVVCNEQHRFIVAEQLQAGPMAPAAIILEPVGRNTAPAVAIAALAVLDGRAAGEDPVLLVAPADHLILDVPAFHAAVRHGLAAANSGKLVTFGVVPSRPETGYGYIRRSAGAGPSYPIAEFVEKPNAAKAEAYVACGEYLWNSGVFMFRARRFLEELERFAPELLARCATALAHAHVDLDFTRLPKDEFARCPSDSVDYAVMEKTTAAVVVPLDAGWSDVGSWSALHESLAADASGNVTRGDVLTEETRAALERLEAK